MSTAARLLIRTALPLRSDGASASTSPASATDGLDAPDARFPSQAVELTTFYTYSFPPSPPSPTASIISSSSTSTSFFAPSAAGLQNRPLRRTNSHDAGSASSPAAPQNARHARSASLATLLPSSLARTSSVSSASSSNRFPATRLASSSASARRMTADERRELADKIWRDIWQSGIGRAVSAAMAHPWTRQEKIKRGVWAAAVAAIIAVGSITGAQLKTDRQKEQAIREFRQTSPEEQIAILETQKNHLLQQKGALERKLDLFHQRVKERESTGGKSR
ncbi:hypothetical protein HIM_10130 [Hirsutella minnesotensis 3608]|uniref:Uncharacterized protein n=1 Tax=Hirsutella minnesotensis 3608 TaxID=1043627 RepID=A0A0F7ZG95_9HYPO|nr:hypothetical protein HIM_10130 [Hirsutella minnesotensis 3608]